MVSFKKIYYIGRKYAYRPVWTSEGCGFLRTKLVEVHNVIQSFFTLTLLDNALILPLMPPYGGSKMQFCDFANKVGRCLLYTSPSPRD